MNAPTDTVARVLILADDLSGAADCAVTGSQLGLRSHVVLHQDAAARVADDADKSGKPVDVLAIDLDSRRQSPAVAAQIHIDAWRALGDPAIRAFKKVDSTLRGNVASEVAALTREIGMAIVAPAFPSAGRTTVDGRQLLHGVVLEETEVWRNEHIPGRADLLEMMSSAGLHAEPLSLDSVRAHPDVLTRRLITLQASGAKAVICDAQTDDDLHRIASASGALADVFWVGSAGLARPWMLQMAHVAREEADVGVAHHSIAADVARPVLTVVGSMSSISHAQVAALRQEAGASILALEIDTQALLDPNRAERATPAAATIQQALEAGRDVLVSLSQKDRTRVADGLLLCEALAHLLAPVVPLAGTVIATGGETARALLHASGVHSLQIVEEIEHGVPLMYAMRPSARAPLQVITKAGGFGTPQTLVTAWRRAKTAMRGAPAAQNQLSLSIPGLTPAPGAEDRPFQEELTQ